jgi:hypothetical protein
MSVELQLYLNESGFGIEFTPSYLESETDTGPKKRRRRTTQNFERIAANITIDRSVYLTFRNFYDVTLSGGVLPFMFPHPITLVSTKYRMDSPKITPIGGTYFTVSMMWEEI